MAAVGNPRPTEDYLRLQKIEQRVITCIRVAAEVLEKFSMVGRTTDLAGQITELCTRFMTTVTEALQLVKEGVESSGGEHRVELHAYHGLARAHINTEKLQVLRMYLNTMQEELQEATAELVAQGLAGALAPAEGAAAAGAQGGAHQAGGAGAAAQAGGDGGGGQGPAAERQGVAAMDED